MQWFQMISLVLCGCVGWCIGLSGVFLNPSREKLTPFAKRGEGTRKLLSSPWFSFAVFEIC